jgi:hypothetical protein
VKVPEKGASLTIASARRPGSPDVGEQVVERGPDGATHEKVDRRLALRVPFTLPLLEGFLLRVQVENPLLPVFQGPNS